MAQIQNGDFSSYTLTDMLGGAGLFNNAALWNLGTGWSISAGAASRSPGDSSALSLKAEVEAYQPVKHVIGSLTLPSGKLSIKYSFINDTVQYTTGGAKTYYGANTGTSATAYSITATNDSGSVALDDVYCYKMSLDNWTYVGDSKTNSIYSILDGSVNTVRIIAPQGFTAGYEQTVANGKYRLTVDVEAIQGNLIVSDGDTSKKEINTTGTVTFTLLVKNGKIKFATKGASDCDITINSITEVSYVAFSVTPSSEREISWLGEVLEADPDHYMADEDVYTFGNGRTFKTTDKTNSGIYE